MISAALKYTFVLFAIVLHFGGSANQVLALDIKNGNTVKDSLFPRVEWVKNWPASNQTHQVKGIRVLLNSVFFGIKPPVLRNPVSILANNPGAFWVLDQGGSMIFQVRDGLGEIPHPIKKNHFDWSSLVGICAGPGGSILFTDSHDCKIYRLSSGSKKLTVLNDSLKLEQPTGIAWSPLQKEIWVIETKAHRITILSESGELIRQIGNRGNRPGEFNYPTHIWIDKHGYVYITDAMNFRIQVLNFKGEIISVFGEAGDATGYLARPKGVATDSQGNIYIVDALFHVIQVFDMQGAFLYKFGVQGHGNGEFWMPSGIFIDSQDYIYVADSYNSRVQIFHLIHPDEK